MFGNKRTNLDKNQWMKDFCRLVRLGYYCKMVISSPLKLRIPIISHRRGNQGQTMMHLPTSDPEATPWTFYTKTLFLLISLVPHHNQSNYFLLPPPAIKSGVQTNLICIKVFSSPPASESKCLLRIDEQVDSNESLTTTHKSYLTMYEIKNLFFNQFQLKIFFCTG